MNRRRSISLQLFVVLATALAVAGCKNQPKQSPALKPVPAPTTTAVAAAPTTSPALRQEADRLRPMIAYLASDELEGRGLQTEGINKAADFVAARFKEAGLKPMP